MKKHYITKTYYIEESVISDILAIARQENRSASYTVNELLKEIIAVKGNKQIWAKGIIRTL